MDRLHTSISFTGRGGSAGRLQVDIGGGTVSPAAATAATAPSQLRHPRTQHHADGMSSLDPHAQRVVATLLRELDAAQQHGAAAHAELASVKGELLRQQREQDRRSRTSGAAAAASSGGSKSKAGPAAAIAAKGSVPLSGQIKAFRPPGQAAPCKALQAARPVNQPAAAPQHVAPAAPDLAELQRDNAEMRTHLQALLSHCQQLQRKLEASAASAASAVASPPSEGQPQRQLAGQRVARAAAAEHYGSSTAAAEQCSSSERRPRSPGRATAVVASPRADGSDLAVAVFEPPPEDAVDLRLALNRMQRQNLKLSSKLSKAQEEAAERGAEARRWRHAVERQAGEIGELRVEVEGERRRQRELEAALSAAAGEVAAAQQHVAELMGQLAAAEAAVAAAEGEATALRGQLGAAEEQRGRARSECERLKEEAVSTAARLSATDLVRREAERERDALELQAQRLRAALAEAEASSSAAAEELTAHLAAAQQQVAVEQQRNEMLQAQLSLGDAQARETERVLTEQLRAVQEERNTCLAAATRADALLVRLGQHALTTRGSDC